MKHAQIAVAVARVELLANGMLSATVPPTVTIQNPVAGDAKTASVSVTKQ